jgi:hypothetical protein
LSKVLEVLSLRRLHGEISERISKLGKRSILKLHQDLFEGTGKGGIIRESSANLPGSAFMPPPAILVEDELEGLLQWWHDPSPLHPFERAVLFHHRFQQVRPFESGNAYLSGLVAGDRGDRTNLISNFWKSYKNQHQPTVGGGRDAMRLEPRQSQLEAF